MTNSLFENYKKRGVTKWDDFIISKSWRDSHPVDWNNPSPNDWPVLTDIQ